MERQTDGSDEKKGVVELDKKNDRSNVGEIKNKKLYEQNSLHNLVNALPYIDSYDNELEKNAKRMIEEEMELMITKKEVKDYLKDYPWPILTYLNENSVIPNELRRCEKNEKMKKLNFDYYTIEKDNLNDLRNMEEWEKMVKKHQLLLENLHNALINIELMNKYKEVMWSEHMKMFTHIDINLQNSIKMVKDDIDNINKKRKLHQLSYVNDLTTLQNERKEYKRKNTIVLKEIKKLLFENRLMRYKHNLA
ncbi:pre-mRNA-splicing factor CWF7, putative [Plasmodium ovale]|uniref:Pre-mRNA-splicing factor CWF7 n=2 Tax=Plasmodium ovale TaxID=36330 RepID=A0A1A8WRF1_PLAOA|nr:conserved protein, unknown function [Plasmodium ovale curtisi]SBS94884.1 conserved protein, unknown function [Plasmodium ovale curtisi]SCP05120.1 pre-mRNA-splicing factor CWF7, putative [Plasmodium ovale]